MDLSKASKKNPRSPIRKFKPKGFSMNAWYSRCSYLKRRAQAPTVDVNTIVYKDAIVWVQRRSIDESIDESPIKLFKNELIIENCLMIIGR